MLFSLNELLNEPRNELLNEPRNELLNEFRVPRIKIELHVGFCF
jgi:hypothetical protein